MNANVRLVGWSDRNGAGAGDDNCLFSLARFVVVVALIVWAPVRRK